MPTSSPMLGKLQTKIHSQAAMPDVIKFIELWDFDQGGVSVLIEPISDRLSYLAVFWIWMRTFADSFTKRDKNGQTYTDKDMHDLLCHKFLGCTKPRAIGNKTTIPPALITLTFPEKLEGALFGELLTKIEVWSAEVGVTLPRISDSEYMTYKEAS